MGATREPGGCVRASPAPGALRRDLHAGSAHVQRTLLVQHRHGNEAGEHRNNVAYCFPSPRDRRTTGRWDARRRCGGGHRGVVGDTRRGKPRVSPQGQEERERRWERERESRERKTSPLPSQPKLAWCWFKPRIREHSQKQWSGEGRDPGARLTWKTPPVSANR
jgi:hypothetical protein